MISKYIQKIEYLKGQRNSLEKSLSKKTTMLNTSNQNLNDLEEALKFIQNVSKEAQELLTIKIVNIVNNAMKLIFKNPYLVKVEFKSERNKTTCHISFIKNGKEFKEPLYDCGIGTVDIASFALKISALALSTSARILAIDEPFKCLDSRHSKKLPELIQLLSKELDTQFIIITHSEYLKNFGNKNFHFSKLENTTVIMEVNNE